MKRSDEFYIFIIIVCVYLVIRIIFCPSPRGAVGLGADGLDENLLASEEADVSASVAASTAAAASTIPII